MLIRIDMSSEIPIYQQIRDQVVMGIGTGELENGELLPLEMLQEQLIAKSRDISTFIQNNGQNSLGTTGVGPVPSVHGGV